MTSEEPLLPAANQKTDAGIRRWLAFCRKRQWHGANNSPGIYNSLDGLDLLEQQSAQSFSSSTARRMAGAGSATARGLMHARAAEKLQQLNASYRSRRQLQREEDLELPGWVVHPHDILAQCWWTFILCTVIITLFVEPYNLCFSHYPGLYPLTSPDTLFAIAYSFIYASDVFLNFFVAYHQDGELVTDLRSIARHYARGRLWADLVTTIPFDWLVLGLMGLQRSNSTLAWYISLLRLLRLGRAYRLYGWVQLMTYNQTLSLLAVTLTRNFALCFFTVHWGACGFYYIAKQSGFSDMTWVGANMDWVGRGSSFDKWTYSMYWSIITFATVGYGDLHAYSVAEAAYVVLYMFVSIGVAAYIVGTSVVLVQENEKKTGAYRDRLIVLDDYSLTHDIPKSLQQDMKGHLRLHFSSADSSDEAVLSVYPTTIRRRILRHLYSVPLHSCWLFNGCKQKFLDALLLAAKVELYMPKVDIVSAGDFVNELQIILAGAATAERGNPIDTLLAADGATSVHGGSLRSLGPGDTCGEMAFFTETPCLEYVRTTSVCRVMTIPRALYNVLTGDFPFSARAVMDNLVVYAEKMIQREFPGPSGLKIMESLDDLAALQLKFASPEFLSGATVGSAAATAQGALLTGNNSKSSSTTVSRQSSFTGSLNPGWRTPPLYSSLIATSSVDLDAGCTNGMPSSCPPPLPLGPNGLPLRQGQQQVLASLLRVLALAKQSQAKLDQQRTHQFLNACLAGQVDKIKLMLQQGCDADTCDYSGRTGLMLAAECGSVLAVKLLLLAGASVSATDHTGSCAVLEACMGGHDAVLELLLQHDGRICMSGEKAAGLLCSAVHSGDMQLLRRLLRAGVDPNSCDYDKRTALHIAAADGNLLAVKLLIESGNADPSLCDRWGHTALDEARHVGALPVVEYLNSNVTDACRAESVRQFQYCQAQALLTAAKEGDVNQLQKLLGRGCPPDACDYDGRTALLLAAANGQQAAVSLLLSAGANPNVRDSLGSSALLEAVRFGHTDIVEQLKAVGATLHLSSRQMNHVLCDLVLEDKQDLLRWYLTAGADVAAADHNQQTALHVAAYKGNMVMVQLLVEEGGALVADRWGKTPLDEAVAAGHSHIVEYLNSLVTPSHGSAQNAELQLP